MSQSFSTVTVAQGRGRTHARARRGGQAARGAALQRRQRGGVQRGRAAGARAGAARVGRALGLLAALQ